MRDREREREREREGVEARMPGDSRTGLEPRCDSCIRDNISLDSERPQSQSRVALPPTRANYANEFRTAAAGRC